MKVAIVGADGCLGTRLIETFQLDEGPSVAAVVSDPARLARAARFTVDLRVADPLDAGALARAFAGCSAAVLAHPLPETGRRAVAQFCRAAADARLRRVVYVSSAEVHGLAPAAGTDEQSRLHERHASAHVNALVAAERQFHADCRARGLAALVLQPGLLYGPRCEFVTDIAVALAEDRAVLLRPGDGICNCLGLDNLVLAVRAALRPKAPAGGAFLVVDDERVTWRGLYEAVARDFRLRTSGIRYADPDTAAAAALAADARARQQCAWKLPGTRAQSALGPKNPVSFAEGLRRTAAWWRFAHGDFSAAA